jgi:hypothetical protein
MIEAGSIGRQGVTLSFVLCALFFVFAMMLCASRAKYKAQSTKYKAEILVC